MEGNPSNLGILYMDSENTWIVKATVVGSYDLIVLKNWRRLRSYLSQLSHIAAAENLPARVSSALSVEKSKPLIAWSSQNFSTDQPKDNAWHVSSTARDLSGDLDLSVA